MSEEQKVEEPVTEPVQTSQEAPELAQEPQIEPVIEQTVIPDPSKETIKVFGFLANAHLLLCVDTFGRRLISEDLEDGVIGKDIAMTDRVKILIDEQIGPNWRFEWVDDPGANMELIEACERMESTGGMGQLEIAKPEQAEVPEEPPAIVEDTAVSKPEPKTRIRDGEIIYRDVKCKMTTSHEALLNAVKEMQRLEIARNDEMAEYNRLIKEAKKRVCEMTAGEIMTTVACTIRYDWDAGVKAIVRNDTQEVIERVDITDDERQQQLALFPEDPAPEFTAPPVVSGEIDVIEICISDTIKFYSANIDFEYAKECAKKYIADMGMNDDPADGYPKFEQIKMNVDAYNEAYLSPASADFFCMNSADDANDQAEAAAEQPIPGDLQVDPSDDEADHDEAAEVAQGESEKE